MGISMQEILSLEYFKDFEVIAGGIGLNKEVQGITTMEAPDCFKWTRGKELVLSSGYVLSKEPDCIARSFEEGSIQQISGLMIKRDRYLKEIPKDVVELFDMHGIPLITMPFAIPWMDIASQVNTAVMNRTIRRFRVQDSSDNPMNRSFKERRIRKILQAVEIEMKFPACLYDLRDEVSYHSSSNFLRITKSYGLEEKDYWEASQPHTKHTLCEYIGMTRYRLINQSNFSGPRVSWVLIPIVVNGVEQAYFVVMESREFLDYYDEISIRIAFLILQSMYEQFIGAKDMGNIGFENFIHYAISCGKGESHKLAAQAAAQGISVTTPYNYVVFRQVDGDFPLQAERKKIMEAFQTCALYSRGKLAFLDDKEGMILLNSEVDRASEVESMLNEFLRKVRQYVPDLNLQFGVCRCQKTLTEIVACVEKCHKVLEMGKKLFPERICWDYEMLGPFAWIHIPEEELEILLARFKILMKDEKSWELLHTLKVYLENNMNFSMTADKLYVHINTIRKRIEKVDELLKIEWDEPMERMKLQLLLNYLELK